ncbi:MAG: anthranilate synthase component I family protein [Phycisphaerales bacterium]
MRVASHIDAERVELVSNAAPGDTAVSGPGDAQPYRASNTEIIEPAKPNEQTSGSRELLSSALQPGADRLILLPYDAATDFEPAILRQPPIAHETNFPMVAQTLGSASALQSPRSFHVGLLESKWGRAGFLAGVETVLRHIAAGDVYQVNLSHRLAAPFNGDASAFARNLTRSASPEFGGFACFEHKGVRHAVISLSPELFLRYNAQSRVVETKPMKGTRPLANDPSELRDAEKDRAELNMIVDLMRNDLGRVADPGTVRVTRTRDIDPHAQSVWQATATVEAKLSDRHSPAELLACCFPPGSVTGAPKVRAAQIIRELEPHTRGPYCGSLVRVQRDGSFTASVLIRTAHIVGTPDPSNPHSFLDAQLRFSVGAGIVADSNPAAEWEETMTKASVLTSVLQNPST